MTVERYALFYVVAMLSVSSRAALIQGWNDVKLYYRVSKPFRLYLSESIRIQSAEPTLYHVNVQGGINYRLPKVVTLDLSYRHIGKWDGEEVDFEYQPRLSIKFTFGLKPFTLFQRNLCTVRFAPQKDPSTVYSNRIGIQRAFKIGSVQFRPYIAEDIRINLFPYSFRENRIYCGLRLKVPGIVTPEVSYFLKQRFSDDEWGVSHVFRILVLISVGG
jgi:hypothetical protein